MHLVVISIMRNLHTTELIATMSIGQIAFRKTSSLKISGGKFELGCWR